MFNNKKIVCLNTMKRKVSIGSNLSESVMVKDRYEACIEEHL